MQKKWILASLLCVSLTCQADPIDVYLSVGPAFSDLTNNSTVRINQFVVNDYDSDDETEVGPLTSLGLGYTFNNVMNKPLSIALALMGYFIDYDDVEGTESPFVNVGQFDTLDYRFRAESYAAMVESRFIYTQMAWQPFALLGIGASWNRLFDYDEWPSNSSSSAAPVPSGFDANTETSFAYEAGVGVRHQLFYDPRNKIQWQILFDYRYMNLGEAELDEFPAQTVDDTLEVENLHTQALVFTIQASVGTNNNHMKDEING